MPFHSKILNADFDTFDQMQDACNESIARIIGDGDLLDEDGYPTDAALSVVSMWPKVGKDLFTFMISIWHMPTWGCREAVEDSEWDGSKVTRYYLSTGGWSGNESIIQALKNNEFLAWGLTWVMSRRGGHYVFEVGADPS